MKNVNLEKATLNILLELEGKVYMIGMTQENLDAINFLVKSSAKAIIPTEKTQNELLRFLGR